MTDRPHVLTTSQLRVRVAFSWVVGATNEPAA